MSSGWAGWARMPSPRWASPSRMLSLVFAIGLGLSLSTTAMVARRIGEKDPEDAAIAGVQAIVLGLRDLARHRHSRPASSHRSCCT